MKNLCISGMLLLCFARLHAQTKNENEYREHSKEVAAEIWNKKSAEFSVSQVPAEFNNESAVIIAKEVIVVNTAKKKFHFSGLGGSVTNKLSFDNTLHIRVKINDKAALEEFSSIEYEKQLVRNTRQNWSTYYNQRYTFVGAKVIKPGGKEVIVNGDEEVLTLDEKKKKQGKLAISDLQVGDILDYYIKEEIITEAESGIQGPFTFFLNSDYPILSSKAHMELDEKAGAVYVSANGAPKPTVSQNDNGIVIDLNLKNLSKTTDNKWVLPMRQLPYVSIEYQVMTKGSDNSAGIEKGEVKPAPGWEKFISSLKSTYRIAVTAYTMRPAPPYWDRAREYFGGKKDLRSAPADSLVKVLYNLLLKQSVLKAIGSSNYTLDDVKSNLDDASIFDFSIALDRSDVPHELVFVVPKSGPKKQDVMIGGTRLVPLLHVQGGAKDIWIDFEKLNMFTNRIPSWLEGEDAEGFTIKRGWTDARYKLPVSKASDNVISEKLDVVLSASNMQTLEVNRNTILTGNYIEGGLEDLQTTQGYIKSLYGFFKNDTELKDDLKEFKVKKDIINNVDVALAKEAEKQKDHFNAEIKEWFDQDPKELTSYKVVAQTPTAFSYSSTFTMENWVKKAGNNYIVEAGRLIGSFDKLEEKERKRTLDIYLSFARTLQYSYTITIPSGYSAKGLENFNKNISNETGDFISSATQSGDKIVFTAKRVFNNSYQPVNNWSKMLEILDAAYDYTQQKLLLEKNK